MALNHVMMSERRLCYEARLTNATAVDDTIRFVSQTQNVLPREKTVTKCNEVGRVKVIENVSRLLIG
jgi:hypothetical protein